MMPDADGEIDLLERDLDVAHRLVALIGDPCAGTGRRSPALRREVDAGFEKSCGLSRSTAVSVASPEVPWKARSPVSIS